jgi:hypothetical protein
MKLSKEEFAEKLEELKNKDLPHCDYSLILDVTREITEAEKKELQEYFLHFVQPSTEKQLTCVGCGQPLTGFLQGTFQWGIANGEGFCYVCGYPARAYHRNVGPVEFFNFILQYHPDELSVAKEEEEDA